MKNLWILLLFSAPFLATSQTMRWVPIKPGDTAGKCSCASSTKNDYLCFTLEYTPAVSGTLTSYTTGFLVSCSSVGSPIVRNEACTMTNNVKVVNGCEKTGKILFNSSGNSGSGANNVITAGKPISLHQICFNIPSGQSISLEEETLTDLTTSVDVGGGMAVTEYPTYVTQTIRQIRYDTAKPTVWLDVKAVSAGDRISQIDWSINGDKEIVAQVVERSTDGVTFEPIGKLEKGMVPGQLNVFQFIDKEASYGKNYYRVILYDKSDNTEESPVRWVAFDREPFAINISPNPADDYVMVNVKGQESGYEIRLVDNNGQTVLTQKPDKHTIQTRLNVDPIPAGVYTVQVLYGGETYIEKVVINTR